MTIKGDHNHLNAVYSCFEYTFFTAHTFATSKSCIGYIRDNTSYIYQYNGGRGIHDFALFKNSLYFTDSFASGQMKYCDSTSGFLVKDGIKFGSDIFNSQNSSFVIRSIALKSHLSVVGASVFARRNERSKKSGGLFFINDSNDFIFYDGPYSQLYDVAFYDLSSLGHLPLQNLDHNFLHNLFLQSVGDLVNH